MASPADFDKFRALYPSLEVWREGGVDAAFVPLLKVIAAGATHEVQILLWPNARDGYPSRLFVSEKLPGARANNWNSFAICGRTWWACSWSGVQATLPLAEMLANHLRAFE